MVAVDTKPADSRHRVAPLKPVSRCARVLVMSARPGRIKFKRAVPFAHLHHYSIKTSPEFVALKAELTGQVQAEVLASVAVAAA